MIGSPDSADPGSPGVESSAKGPRVWGFKGSAGGPQTPARLPPLGPNLQLCRPGGCNREGHTAEPRHRLPTPPPPHPRSDPGCSLQVGVTGRYGGYLGRQVTQSSRLLAHFRRKSCRWPLPGWPNPTCGALVNNQPALSRQIHHHLWRPTPADHEAAGATTNCSSSVEPGKAVVELWPPPMMRATSSK